MSKFKLKHVDAFIEFMQRYDRAVEHTVAAIDSGFVSHDSSYAISFSSILKLKLIEMINFILKEFYADKNLKITSNQIESINKIREKYLIKTQEDAKSIYKDYTLSNPYGFVDVEKSDGDFCDDEKTPLRKTKSHMDNKPPVQDSKLVPKIIHYVWFGRKIPRKYLLNILNAYVKAKDYKIYVWTDNPSAMQRQLLSLDLPIPNLDKRLTVKNINALKNHHENDPDKKQCDLLNSAIDRERAGHNRNLACAADIARCRILLRYGGVYLDTDVFLTKEVGGKPLNAPDGVLLYCNARLIDLATKGMSTNNCVIAALPNSKKIRATLDDITENVKNYSYLHNIKIKRCKEHYFIYLDEKSRVRSGDILDALDSHLKLSDYFFIITNPLNKRTHMQKFYQQVGNQYYIGTLELDTDSKREENAVWQEKQHRNAISYLYDEKYSNTNYFGRVENFFLRALLTDCDSLKLNSKEPISLSLGLPSRTLCKKMLVVLQEILHCDGAFNFHVNPDNCSVLISFNLFKKPANSIIKKLQQMQVNDSMCVPLCLDDVRRSFYSGKRFKLTLWYAGPNIFKAPRDKPSSMLQNKLFLWSSDNPRKDIQEHRIVVADFGNAVHSCDGTWFNRNLLSTQASTTDDLPRITR